MKKLLFAGILCFSFGFTWAQENLQASIKVIARVKNDTVLLRWGPTTSLAWEQANKNGYIVKRYRVIQDGVLDTVNRPQEVLLTPTPIKPLPLDSWEALAKNDNYAAIAAQALYGKAFILSNPSSGSVQLYNQTEERESRWSFALFAADHSAKTAQGLGLRVVDLSVKKNEKYAYQVSIANPSKQYPVATGTVFVDPEGKVKLPAPEDLKAEFGDLSVSLSWKSFYLQQIYVSYVVERSDDDGKTFKPATDQVFFNTLSKKNEFPQRTFYVDSLPKNYTVYHYRVRGATPFGEMGSASEPVKGVGLGSAKGATAVIDLTHVYDDGRVHLQWKFPKELKDKLSGFEIGRGKTAYGPFSTVSEKVIDVNVDYFIDKKPEAVSYYVVKAISKNGTTTTSFAALVQLYDAIPPVIPSGLSGKIDDKGIVSLEWTANTEADLSGYKVFKANSLNEEFVQVTKEVMTENHFTDTISIQTLTKDVFYKIVALDYRYNTSEYSEALELKRPDIIAPSGTQFVKAESNNDHIYLEWFAGVDNDIKVYQLYRSISPDTTFHLVKEFFAADSIYSFRDNDVKAGTQYTYKIRIMDDAGLKSPYSVISVTSIDYGSRPPVNEIRYGIDRDKRQVVLQWSYALNDISGFQIFRAKQGSPLRLYKFVSTNSFQDKNLTANTNYIYVIKAIFKSGAESELSKEITITY